MSLPISFRASSSPAFCSSVTLMGHVPRRGAPNARRYRAPWACRPPPNRFSPTCSQCLSVPGETTSQTFLLRRCRSPWGAPGRSLGRARSPDHWISTEPRPRPSSCKGRWTNSSARPVGVGRCPGSCCRNSARRTSSRSRVEHHTPAVGVDMHALIIRPGLILQEMGPGLPRRPGFGGVQRRQRHQQQGDEGE